MKHFPFILLFVMALAACKKDTTPSTLGVPATDTSYLIFKFKFDSSQQRLNSLGAVASMPAGHWGQSPKFNVIGAHYFELAPTMYTQLGSGAVLYKGQQTTVGGGDAIAFEQISLVGDGEVALKVPLKSIAAGSYSYLRVSLAYQNYSVYLRASGYDMQGTLASFIGFNSYVKNYKIKDSMVSVNANKLQGYWGFETIYNVSTGDAAGTTVVNPIAATSPIPAGSCVVTAAFPTALQITGSETSDITVTMSLSTNQSFEWNDANSNHIWEPTTGENVVDMGIRGMVLSVN